MIVAYLFSSPEGDVSLDLEDLSRPFLITPEKAHPHLTLGDYFDTVKACILKNRGELLKCALKNKSHENFNLEDVRKIQIRSEKHGILYHLASVEVITTEKRVKFTLSTAISKKGIEYILHEHDILNRLNHNSGFSFLPEIYGIRRMTCHTAQGKTEEMVMLAAQWFEDYHEWHMSIDPLDGRQKIKIWDLKRGSRYASTTEASIIIEKCSKILTLYYDFGDFSHIDAWHHAAGDFIVNTQRDGKLNVRLTTVRKYEPQPATEDAGPMIAMIYFFLDTTVKMRLDRLDGVGETVWLDDFAVTAAVKGFFEGLRAYEAKGDGAEGVRADDLLTLMQSFDAPELKWVFEPLLTHYRTQYSDEATLIIIRLNNHINFLRQALQDFH
ncbi:MAG: hypothetical protein J7M20_10920 [Deltaproteobacteria bacterium]|nr:hypothetical protein [Deltaproteobacteria bacterium]